MSLLEQFVADCQTVTPVRRFIVAYSGGMDSRVLLELAFLAQEAGAVTVPVSVVHVNHQLQADADQWQQHCESLCQQLALPLTILKVTVQDTGSGLEAAAREARRNAWAQYLEAGDVLLLAHHLADQAETILYRLCRGTGPKGLQGMVPLSVLGKGKLYRPLLSCEKSALQAFAEQKRLQWIEDPSNMDVDYDRNFLRQDILPRLMSRWPKVNSAIARAGTLCGVADATSALQADRYLEQAKVIIPNEATPGLSVDALLAFEPVWRSAVIRQWLLKTKNIIPSYQQLKQVEQEVLLARLDAQPKVTISDHCICRSQGIMYVMSHAISTMQEQAQVLRWNVQENGLLNIGEQRQLKAHTVLGQGLHLPQAMRENIEVRWGNYGRKAKKVFQSLRIPTWNRSNYPVILSQGHLLAIVGLWYSPRHLAAPTAPGWFFSEIIN